MKTVWVLQRTDGMDADVIGVYSTKETVDAAIKKEEIAHERQLEGLVFYATEHEVNP